jgi:Tat protein secretion system quality control protein TatD with DNase activity
VAERVALLRGETLTEVALTSSANAARLFGLTLHNV